MIASTYVNNESTAMGISGAYLGDKIQTKHTLNYDVTSSLKKVVDKNNVYVVAILTTTNGTFVNARKAKVLSHTVGINGLETENAREMAVYSLDGVQKNALTRGMNILRMSDGKVKKVSIPIR